MMRNEEEKGTFIMSSRVCVCVCVFEREFQSDLVGLLRLKQSVSLCCCDTDQI